MRVSGAGGGGLWRGVCRGGTVAERALRRPGPGRRHSRASPSVLAGVFVGSAMPFRPRDPLAEPRARRRVSPSKVSAHATPPRPLHPESAPRCRPSGVPAPAPLEHPSPSDASIRATRCVTSNRSLQGSPRVCSQLGQIEVARPQNPSGSDREPPLHPAPAATSAASESRPPRAPAPPLHHLPRVRSCHRSGKPPTPPARRRPTAAPPATRFPDTTTAPARKRARAGAPQPHRPAHAAHSSSAYPQQHLPHESSASSPPHNSGQA